jgi:hypothetical protein
MSGTEAGSKKPSMEMALPHAFAHLKRIHAELAQEKLISKEEALTRVDPAALDQLLHPTIDHSAERKVIATGLPASPGAACGKGAGLAEMAHLGLPVPPGLRLVADPGSTSVAAACRSLCGDLPSLVGGDSHQYSQHLGDHRAKAPSHGGICLVYAGRSPRRLSDRVRKAGRDVLQAGFYRRELAIHFLDRDVSRGVARCLEFEALALGSYELGTLFRQASGGVGNKVGPQVPNILHAYQVGVETVGTRRVEHASVDELADALRSQVEVACQGSRPQIGAHW